METLLNRRRFLYLSGLALPALPMMGQVSKKQEVSIQIPSNASGPTIPTDFLGLSYETQQLVDPSVFSPLNHELIDAFTKIARNGVLRLGGDTCEFGYWKPNPDSPEPVHPKTREVEGEPKSEFFPVTSEAVRNLCGFLDATGWTCIYGINLGTNTPERAAAEAKYVFSTLGHRLQYFQLGNEVDQFSEHLRDPQTWSAESYLKEWLAMARAITQEVPSAAFGIPDLAGDFSWIDYIVSVWPTIPNPPRIVAFSHHHYFSGPATNPIMTIPNLLGKPEVTKINAAAKSATAAARSLHIPVRMTEANTCYSGGKPGLSDVFAAAIWAADYSLRLAEFGYSGVNLHGGEGKTVANSVGGILPGDVLLEKEGLSSGEIAKYPHPFYTPIAIIGTQRVIEPVAHGLRFAGYLSGGTFLPVDFAGEFDRLGLQASGFAVQMPDGSTAMILLNKEAKRDIDLSIKWMPERSAKVTARTLQAESFESRSVHLSEVRTLPSLRGDRYQITVSRSSGLLLQFHPA